MQLDLEEGRPDVGSIDRVISWREGVLLSIIVHLLFVLAGYMAPQWFAVDPEVARARAAALQAARDHAPSMASLTAVVRALARWPRDRVRRVGRGSPAAVSPEIGRAHV